MRDWKLINKCRVTEENYHGRVPRLYVSDPSFGLNGMFRVPWKDKILRVIASDGEGWEHVSVSIENDPSRCPTWEAMCFIKEMFWDDDRVVMQLHPAKKDYVNFHKGCLHLWMPTEAAIPTPPSIMVGPKP